MKSANLEVLNSMFYYLNSKVLFSLEQKLNIDYYVDDILDEDQQEELHEYFLESESEDISDALTRV